jgi:hypothetical protein
VIDSPQVVHMPTLLRYQFSYLRLIL